MTPGYIEPKVFNVQTWDPTRRYTVLRNEVVFDRTMHWKDRPPIIRRDVPVAHGLSLQDARRLAERMDEEARLDFPKETSWTRPLHFPQLEKPCAPLPRPPV